MARASDDIRNLAVIGHGHAGKTTLVDAIAHHLKLTTRLGSSAAGTSISDTEPEEKERHQTLASHAFRMPAGNVDLEVFDTPGHPDFLAEALASIDVVETAVLVVNATNPLTFHSRQLWDAAGRLGVGRAIVVTHLDQANTNFETVVETLRTELGHAVVPATYPNANGGGFDAVHDVTHDEGPLAPKYHDMIEEDEAEVDDTLMEHYLEEGHLSHDEFERNLRRAVARGKLVPVFAVCPNRGLGIECLVEFMQKHFPSPVCFGARGAAKPGTDVYGQLVEPDQGPFAAKVWKVVSDPYLGRVTYLRAYRGELHKDESIVDTRTGQTHKVVHLHSLQGTDIPETDAVVAGDLFAISKIDQFGLGDTLTAEGSLLEFPRPAFPQPTYSRHVWPKARGDEQKIGHALEKMAAEDATLQHERDPETGELLVTGMSPMHLDITFQRLQRRHGVGVEQGPPTIPYRETITAPAEGHHKHRKQSGGRGQFAEVYLRLVPREHGAGYEFTDGVVGGAIPRQFVPDTDKGSRKFLAKGPLAGFPVVDVGVEVYDGKYHDVDSDSISFQMAAERACIDGFAKARPILLEPFVDVVIHVPERFTGDVAGSLSSNRGRLSGMEVENGVQRIQAQCPFSAMLDYATQLRSITAGEGSFSMRHSHYEPVPPHIQNSVVKRKLAAQA